MLLSELQKLFAEQKIWEPTLAFSFARALREAGLVSQKGHGRAAAQMTPNDHAVMMIAALASQQANRAPQAVEDFSHLQGEVALWGDDRLKHLIPGDAPKFGRAVEYLVALQQAGTLDDILVGEDLEIIVHRNGLHAVIRVGAPALGMEIRFDHPALARWIKADMAGDKSAAAKAQAEYEEIFRRHQVGPDIRARFDLETFRALCGGAS